MLIGYLFSKKAIFHSMAFASVKMNARFYAVWVFLYIASLPGGKGVIWMTEMEKYREHIEYTFHGFCKTGLYHAAINICRKLRQKQQREGSLGYLKEIHIERERMDETFVVYGAPTASFVGRKSP